MPRFDVFVENYGPGVIEQLNIGYEVMRPLNPGLIYGRIKGFGLSGPYSGYKSYDWVAQAAAATFSVTGTPDGPPMRPAPTIGDSGTGIQMALAITAAYVQKQRTGEGQFIEISMQEAVTMFMRTMGLRAWGTEAAPRTGNGTATMNIYPCAPGGPNDYVFIMANTTRMWDTLCVAIERPELVNDPRFADQMGRFQHADELYPEIAAWTCRRTKHEAMRILGEAGVPCSAVMDTLDLFHDPHLSERGFIQTVEHPVAGGAVKRSRPRGRAIGGTAPLRRHRLKSPNADGYDRAIHRANLHSARQHRAPLIAPSSAVASFQIETGVCWQRTNMQRYTAESAVPRDGSADTLLDSRWRGAGLPAGRLRSPAREARGGCPNSRHRGTAPVRPSRL